MNEWLTGSADKIQSITGILGVLIAFGFGVISIVLVKRDKKQRILLQAMQKSNDLLLIQQLPSLSVNPILSGHRGENAYCDILNNGGDLTCLHAKYDSGVKISLASDKLARNQSLRIDLKYNRKYAIFYFSDSKGLTSISQVLNISGRLIFEPIKYNSNK